MLKETIVTLSMFFIQHARNIFLELFSIIITFLNVEDTVVNKIKFLFSRSLHSRAYI